MTDPRSSIPDMVSWHVCWLGEGEYKSPRMMLRTFNPFHCLATWNLESIHSVALACRWKHAFFYLYTAHVHTHTHTHTHTNACASISARLASSTSLCRAPYVKPHSFLLHSMHTISILLDDITTCSLQWLAGTKVYYLESVRFFKKTPPTTTSPAGDVFQSGLAKA